MEPIDEPIQELRYLTEAEDPEFLGELERAISHREAAAAVGHAHSVGLLSILFAYLELAFRVLFGEPSDATKDDQRSE